jgi:tetratricopeptide (TPR) repeat protein
LTKVRFARWADVLSEPAPADDLPYIGAVRHAAVGLAHAAQGRLDEAQKELSAVAATKDDPSLKTMYISSANVASSIVALAHEVLAAELAARRGLADDAARRFTAAVKLEDNLVYMEPPDWPIPVRQLQGAALLALGRAKDAEMAFREDLRKFPDNGWSLSGLSASLTRQGKTAEANEVKTRLERQWSRADEGGRVAAAK